MITEHSINVNDYLTIILSKTSHGIRPMRYDGRDFIKVVYNHMGKEIKQAFYRSTGIHDVNSGTRGMWFPTDGITLSLNASKISMIPLGYFESDFSEEGIEFKPSNYEELTVIEQARIDGQINNNIRRKQKYIDDIKEGRLKLTEKQLTSKKNIFKISKIGDYITPYNIYKIFSDNKNNIEKDILMRFGTEELMQISYMLSCSNQTVLCKKLFDYIPDNIKNTYTNEIPQGIVHDMSTINDFIGDYVSFNHVNINVFSKLKSEYGNFNLKYYNNPLLKGIIVYESIVTHQLSPESQAINTYISDFNQTNNFLINESIVQNDIKEREREQIIMTQNRTKRKREEEDLSDNKRQKRFSPRLFYDEQEYLTSMQYQINCSDEHSIDQKKSLIIDLFVQRMYLCKHNQQQFNKVSDTMTHWCNLVNKM
jgi:hypothetical protein